MLRRKQQVRWLTSQGRVAPLGTLTRRSDRSRYGGGYGHAAREWRGIGSLQTGVRRAAAETAGNSHLRQRSPDRETGRAWPVTATPQGW